MLITIDLSSFFVFSILDFITFIASYELSQKVAVFAPLLRASIPNAPLPANKSNIFLFSTLNCIILNSASFTLSKVGLVFRPSNEINFDYIYFNLFLLYVKWIFGNVIFF